MSGPVQPPDYPLMWADDPSTDYIRPPDEMRAVIEAAGFTVLEWSDVWIDRPPSDAPPGPHGPVAW